MSQFDIVIEVTPRSGSDAYHACLQYDTKAWEHGATFEEAAAAVLRNHCARFGLTDDAKPLNSRTELAELAKAFKQLGGMLKIVFIPDVYR